MRCVMTVLFSVVVLAGCGSSGEDGSPALTGPRYQANLDLAAGRMQMALRGIKTARTKRGLASRLDAGAKRLREAAGNLRPLTVPEDARTAHASLTGALDGLAKAVSLNDEICGGASALTELSRTDAAQRMRSAAAGLARLGYRTRRLTVRRRARANRRLRNGAVVSRSGTGDGAIRITNGGDGDSVLKLATSGGRTILGIYVRAGASAGARGIPPGSYRVLVASGRDWDARRRGFTRDCTFTRFDDELNYRPGITYSLSLTATYGGNAGTESIEEDEFIGR